MRKPGFFETNSYVDGRQKSQSPVTTPGPVGTPTIRKSPGMPMPVNRQVHICHFSASDNNQMLESSSDLDEGYWGLSFSCS